MAEPPVLPYVEGGGALWRARRSITPRKKTPTWRWGQVRPPSGRLFSRKRDGEFSRPGAPGQLLLSWSAPASTGSARARPAARRGPPCGPGVLSPTCVRVCVGARRAPCVWD